MAFLHLQRKGTCSMPAEKNAFDAYRLFQKGPAKDVEKLADIIVKRSRAPRKNVKFRKNWIGLSALERQLSETLAEEGSLPEAAFLEYTRDMGRLAKEEAERPVEPRTSTTSMCVSTLTLLFLAGTFSLDYLKSYLELGSKPDVCGMGVIAGSLLALIIGIICTFIRFNRKIDRMAARRIAYRIIARCVKRERQRRQAATA